MPLPPYTPQTKSELLDVHASVFLFAPDSFVQLPNRPPDEQRTLESSFKELHRGVDHIFRKPRHDEARQHMHAVLDAIYERFKSGDINAGRIMCHDFENLLAQTRP
jgi:hypothetical protein